MKSIEPVREWNSEIIDVSSCPVGTGQGNPHNSAGCRTVRDSEREQSRAAEKHIPLLQIFTKPFGAGVGVCSEVAKGVCWRW